MPVAAVPHDIPPLGAHTELEVFGEADRVENRIDK